MNEKLSFKTVFKKGAVIYNPVLVQLIALCPVVAASTTFLNAAMLSAVLSAELIMTCVISSALLKSFPRWVRMPLYLLIGLAVVCPVLYYFEHYSLNDLSLGMRVYLPLIAINSATAVHCEQYAVRNSVKLAFFDAAAVSIGISVIFLITGAVREICGSGTFAGYEINLPVTLSGAALPFGCLVLLGFLAAALNMFSAKFIDNGAEEDVEEEQTEEQSTEEPVEVFVIDEADGETVPEKEEPVVQEEQPVQKVEPIRDFFGLEDDLSEFLESIGIDMTDEGGGKQ